jgi:DNA-binding beta-propeller fold protein YncE
LPPAGALPLAAVVAVALPGDTSRYDYASVDPGRHILVAVQSRNDIAVIDPVSFMVTQRVSVPGCEHPHGLAVDLGRRALADGAHVVAVDPTSHRSYFPIATGTDGKPALLVREPVGQSPAG